MKITRRDFMHSAAVFSAMGLAPRFLAHAAEEAGQKKIAGFDDDRVLVVVQLGGGNDGLNTVVPYTDDSYHRARPNIGLKEDRLLKLNDDLALNDTLVDLMRLYDDGKAAIIQGVGYPNPDRSHFRSMEIWHTASDSDEFLGDGWLGRYFDNTCSGSARPQAGLAVGSERPQAFDGTRGFGVSTADPTRFGWESGDGADTEDAFEELNASGTPANDTLDFLRHTTANAIRSSEEVRHAAAKGKVEAMKRGPRNAVAQQLAMVAGLIRGDLSTRIYYVSASGFDTHAGQLNAHDRLLAGVGETMGAFQRQLEDDGTADRVTTMVFSEFGRRVQENASGGTDHGTAAPMFLIGNAIQPGLHGTTPGLDKLDQGDLIHTVDFRRIYATVLQEWFAANPKQVLGGSYETMPLFA